MAYRTREAIMDALTSLLEERPMNRITVKDVVERCGVNRNTFYYYFRDLPDLAEAIVSESVERIVGSELQLRTMEDCLDALVSFTLSRKKIILHLYRNTDRARFELSLWRVCRHVVRQYLDGVLQNRRVSAEDRALLEEYLVSVFFGLLSGWLERGLPDDTRETARRVFALKRGHIEQVLDRCENGQ